MYETINIDWQSLHSAYRLSSIRSNPFILEIKIGNRIGFYMLYEDVQLERHMSRKKIAWECKKEENQCIVTNPTLSKEWLVYRQLQYCEVELDPISIRFIDSALCYNDIKTLIYTLLHLNSLFGHTVSCLIKFVMFMDEKFGFRAEHIFNKRKESLFVDSNPNINSVLGYFLYFMEVTEATHHCSDEFQMLAQLKLSRHLAYNYNQFVIHKIFVDRMSMAKELYEPDDGGPFFIDSRIIGLCIFIHDKITLIDHCLWSYINIIAGKVRERTGVYYNSINHSSYMIFDDLILPKNVFKISVISGPIDLVTREIRYLVDLLPCMLA